MNVQNKHQKLQLHDPLASTTHIVALDRSCISLEALIPESVVKSDYLRP